MELFQKPLFQTFGMFVGMLLGLVMHWIVLALKLPFPGYEFGDSEENDPEKGPTERTALKPKSSDVSKVDSTQIPTWMYFFLAIPAIFDLVATALCMMGLQYLDVSIYQMLRGSGIIFVALMKQHVLKEHLQTFHWVGVFWNVVSVVIVGATALLGSGGEDGGSTNVSSAETFLGVCLMMAGAFVQALQFVFEVSMKRRRMLKNVISSYSLTCSFWNIFQEHVMKMDVPAPPLLLIGMEGKLLLINIYFMNFWYFSHYSLKGFWGTVLSIGVMYPLAYFLPGADHGSYEDPFNTWNMFRNSTNIQIAFVIYFFTIFFYNLLAVLVTFMLSSVWHAILDNFRPITGTSLMIGFSVWNYSFLFLARMTLTD